MRFSVEAPDGRKVTIEGPSPPSEADLSAIFAELPEQAQLKPQQERGIVDTMRDRLAGLASDLRIRDEERSGLREAGVGLTPTDREMAQAGMFPLLAMAAPEVLAAPVSAILGFGGTLAGAEIAERGGEKIAPGVGDLTRPVGAVIGGGVGAAVPSMARGAAPAMAQGMEAGAREVARAARTTAGAAKKAAGPTAEMAAEGLMDTALGLIPGGGLVSGVFRRLVARPIMRTVLKTGTRAAQRAMTPRGRSANVGTTSRALVPEGGLPARATLTRIEKAPKKPGIWRMQGGGKAEQAWLESQGLVPGAMGPDDVAAMRARGATADEIEAALLRAGRAPKEKPFGHPRGPVKEKPKDWKPPEPTQDAVAAGLPKKLTPNEHQIIMKLQGLAKSSGNKAAIKQAVKETFGDNWKPIWDFIMSPQTRL